MAEKRMLTKRITDSDEFISMSGTAQALYMHLMIGADDDGFNNQIQMAMFKSHASLDDVRTLLMKRFIIQFESGVIVIKHWRMANAIRKDRYTPTAYQEEFKLLQLKENDSYSIGDERLPNGCQTVAVGKDSIGEDRIEENSGMCGSKELAPPETEFSFCTKDGTYYLDNELYNDFSETYKDISVDDELRKAKVWCRTNVSKRKTIGGMPKFLNGWLGKAQKEELERKKLQYGECKTERFEFND